MSVEQSTRRKFLQMLGLSASATLFSNSALAKTFDRAEIRKLTSQQQEFMLIYEHWMNEFIEVVRVQKTNSDDAENQKKMIALTELAEKFQPELKEFMKDETFSVIFRIAIDRMTQEI